jgi:ATP-dependent DNA ligase
VQSLNGLTVRALVANSTEIECRALLQASGLDAPPPAVYVPPTAMLLRPTFIPPALPSPADRPPIGEWIHEIKHDGYRTMVRRDASGVRVLTRNGHDWSPRYPAIIEAVTRLKARSCLIDGEAVCCDENGLAVFALLRYRERPGEAGGGGRLELMA